MLPCPFCHEQVKPLHREAWFECPACQNWLRLRARQNGSRWLEGGYYANDEIHPLQLPRSSGQAPRGTARASRPSVREMDRENLQAQRLRAESKLRQLEEEIQRVITLRSENRRNPQLTSQYNTELSRLTREQNEWQLYERQLAERENALTEEEKQLARRARSSGTGLAFWFGTILSGAGLYAFSRLIGLPLDLQGYMYLALIALISGFVTIIISRVD
jgi:hypothetical protein